MLRSTRFICAAALAAALSTSTGFAAQVAEAVKIGAINLSYVARTSKTGQAGLARLEDAARKKAAEVEIKSADLRRQQAEYQKQASTMSPRAVADLQKAFEKSQIEFQRFQQDAQAEIQELQNQFDAEFRVKLAPVIDEVSKEKGLQFVFGLEQAAIVWWSPTVDISDDVVKRLNSKAKD